MLILSKPVSYSDTQYAEGEVFTALSSEEKEAAVNKFTSSIEKFRTMKYYSFGYFSDGKKRFVHIDSLKVV